MTATATRTDPQPVAEPAAWAKLDPVHIVPRLPADPPQVIGYRRVSTREQAKEWKASLTTQTDAMVRYAKEKCLTFDPRHVFEDRFSGENAKNRKAFQSMLGYCQSHQRVRGGAGWILVFRASRWGRFDDPDDAAFWRVTFRELGWQVIYVATDLTDELGVRSIVRAVADSSATLERQEIIARAKSGGRKAASLGRWLGRAPLGYRRLALAPNRKPMRLENGERCPPDRYCTLIVEPVEAEIVRWMFDEYAKQGTTGGTVLRLLREKVKTAGPGGTRLRPDLKWTLLSVFSRLQSVTYLGTIRYGRRAYQKHKRTVILGDADCVIVRDAHPALITQAVYDCAQARLQQNRREPRSVRSCYALSGVVTCAQCGSGFQGRGGRKGPPEDPNRYRLYVDKGGWPRSDGSVAPCLHPIVTVTRAKLERAVIGAIKTLVESGAVQAAVREALQRRVEGDRETPSQLRAKLEKSRMELATRQARLMDMIECGALPVAMVKERVGELERDARQLALQAEKIGRVESTRTHHRRALEHALQLAKDFPALCQRLSGPELREVLVPWIKSAEFDKHTRILTLELRAVPGSDASIVVRRIDMASRFHVARPFAVDDASHGSARRSCPANKKTRPTATRLHRAHARRIGR